MHRARYGHVQGTHFHQVRSSHSTQASFDNCAPAATHYPPVTVFVPSMTDLGVTDSTHGGGDSSVLDANYPPQLTVGQGPLGGGGASMGGSSRDLI